MKKAITRIITFMMAVAVFASLALTVASADAKKPEFLLALGDSITTGYGLDGYMEGDAYNCSSYINALAEALGLEAKSSYVNKAVNGATSTDLLALLPEIENYLGYSDLIIVTVGGNDLLGAVPLVASSIAGRSITSLEDAIDVLSNATPESFAALSSNSSFQTRIGAVMSKFAENMNGIAAILKDKAPNARIVFLKQYNPMKNVLGFGNFGNFADTMIGTVNLTIDQVCTASGFEVLDAPSVIDINAAGLTNILNYDIHPNAEGHAEIAKLLADHLGVSLDPAESIPETEPITEPETTPEPVVTTEPETTPELVVTPEPGTIETVVITGYETDTEPQLEASGCLSSVGSAAIITASVCAAFVIKKKIY